MWKQVQALPKRMRLAGTYAVAIFPRKEANGHLAQIVSRFLSHQLMVLHINQF